MTMHHAFTVLMKDISRVEIYRTFNAGASFIAVAEETRVKGTVLRGIVWLSEPTTLASLRAQVPPSIHVDLQVHDMVDYRAYFEHSLWFDRPVKLAQPNVSGTWPLNEQFWKQRPLPGGSVDAALCYYDVRKTELSYADILTKYFFFWCRYPTYIDTCFHMYRAIIY